MLPHQAKEYQGSSEEHVQWPHVVFDLQTTLHHVHQLGFYILPKFSGNKISAHDVDF